MKMNFSKEWLNKRAKLEENRDVSAGTLNLNALQAVSSAAKGEPISVSSEAETPNLAFGRLINLWRRKKGLRIDEMAEKARVEIAELYEIERDIHYTPEPRTVYQLAKTCGFSQQKMLELSGNLTVRDSSLGQEAVRFAARSESVEKLSKDEQRALEEFVKFLSEK
jgi:HTH-type transcriptional regulator, competence development regulator